MAGRLPFLAFAAKLGSTRVREFDLRGRVRAAAGQAIVDTLGGPLAWFARRGARSGKPTAVPQFAARYAFCNGMTPQQRRLTLSRLYPESHGFPPSPSTEATCPPTCRAPGS